MKKILLNFLLLTVLSVIGTSANAAICSQTFTESGFDDDPTVLTILSTDITCNSGGTINSLSLGNSADDLLSNNCITGSGTTWFSFTLSVTGGVNDGLLVTGCGAEFDLTDITGFTSLTITSADEDAWLDGIDITIDVIVDYTPPACAPPTGLNAVVTLPSTVDISWTASASATDYNLEYRVVGAGVWTAAPGNPYAGTTANLTGLSTDDFEYQITSNCPGPITSTPVSGTFTTIPYPGTCATAIAVGPGSYTAQGPSSGGGIQKICNTFAGGSNANWFAYTATATGQATVESTSGGDTYVEILNGACGSLTCYTSNDDGGVGALSLATFSVCAGTTYYIQWTDRWGATAPIDFTITESPACADPSTATLTPTQDGLDATSTWTAGGGACGGGFEWAVVADGGTPNYTTDLANGSGTYPVSIPAVTGLSNGTDYDFYVRDICGASFSNEILTNFTTLPACPSPTALGASNFSAGNVDISWTASASATSYNWEIQPGTTAQGTAGAISTGSGAAVSASAAGSYTNGSTYTLYVQADCGGTAGLYVSYTFTAIIPPANDDCSGAVALSSCSGGPQTLAGTTTNSTVDAAYINCGASGSNTTERGVWYTYVGDDNEVTITTCDPAGTGYDTRLTVYSGTCGSLSCETGNDDMSPACSTGSFRSEVTFNAYAGTTYYVFVHGFQTGTGLSATGNFLLTWDCSPLCLPVPTNDVCASAEALTLGATCTNTSGFNSCASSPAANPSCFSAFATLQDAWYSFSPTTSTTNLRITLGTAADLGYAIYDACGGTQLACNNSITSGADVNLAGLTIGNTYYIQVLSTNANSGSFDICVNSIACAPITGLAASSVTSNSAVLNWSSVESAWNVVVNTNASPPATAAGTYVTSTTYNANSLMPGTTYYAHVRANCGAPVSTWTTISFTTDYEVPANDDCVNATLVSCGQTESINISEATSDGAIGACGTGTGGTPRFGVWYRFIGTGDDVQVSLCGSNFDTKLHIYESADGTCNTLTCLDSNDDGPLCGGSLQSSITFTSVLGTTYYFLPGTFTSFPSGTAYDLEMTVTCIPAGVVTWLGTNTDDDDVNNWSSGVVPDCSVDIFIPLTANNPVFDGTFECNDIGMASSVTPTIDLAGVLGVCGDVSMSNGAIVTGPGVMSLNGTNGGVNFAGALNPSVENLRVASNYTFTGNLNITGSLVLDGGDVNASGGLITLKSNAAGTAYLDDFTNPGNTYTGSLRQERYITTGVVGGTPIGQRLFGSSVATNAVTGLNTTYANYPTGLGQVVPLATCDANNLDQNSPYSNLFEWNEDATFLFGCYQSGWEALNASATTFEAGRGYSAWMNAGSTLSVTGTPNTGTPSYGPLGNTNGVAQAAGWHVLSNPFPSPMNIDAVTADGFTSPQYYNNSTAYSGTYQPAVVAGSEVPIMQGFVAFTAGPNTFSPSNADRIASNNPNFAKSNAWFDYKLEVEVMTNGGADITYLYYSDNTSTQFDINGDCVKRHSDVDKPTLYTKMNGEELSLNGLHLNDLGTSIPMGLIAPKDATYTFNFNGMSTFPANTTIYLEDVMKGTFHDVSNGSFTFSADPSQNGVDRFMIHFVLPASFNLVEATCDKEEAYIIENTTDGRSMSILNNGVEVASGVLDGSSNIVPAGMNNITVFDQFGGSQTYAINVEEVLPVDASIIASATSIEVGESIDFDFDGSGATTYEWTIDGQLVAQTEMFNYTFYQAGTFEVLINAGNDRCDDAATQTITVAEKSTSIVDLPNNGSLNIYTVDGNVVLEFNKVDMGKVNAAIYNMLGQEVAATSVESTGKQTIVNNNWADGYYVVKVQIGEQNVNETILIAK